VDAFGKLKDVRKKRKRARKRTKRRGKQEKGKRQDLSE
jgi:hypothetical protein